ncbi:MAG: DUF4126 domain-containing protein [Acidobacteriia bacterium]|nr:DUF4126 domain-containing protein [Terriglobia bacterium]
MRIASNELFAVLTAISFAAGLNVYATVATIGLLAHTGMFPLPPDLQLLTNWYVIGCCVVLFLVELFADKIPVFDLLWNALHTFVRVPVAALLAYRATAQLSPGWQLTATLLGGAIALAAHSGKTAVRAAVTPSPEPISNVALSVGEDALAVFLTWFATRHPYWAAGVSAALVLAVVVLMGWVVRALAGMLRRARREVSLIFGGV